MGKEARAREMLNTVRMAAIERAMGPVRPHPTEPRLCEKCGLSETGPDGEHLDAFLLAFCLGPDSECPLDQPGQHLHVRCKRCDYGWMERCADYIEPAVHTEH